MERIIEVKPLADYTIWVSFSDHLSGTLNMKPFITKGISRNLLDESFFRNVKIDEFGGICWENGFDFCPNYLHELIEKTN